MAKFVLDMKHPVFEKPAGFGSLADFCALGKVATALFDDPFSFIEGMDGDDLITTEQFQEVYKLNDDGFHSEENHKAAIRLCVEYLKATGRVEVINEDS